MRRQSTVIEIFAGGGDFRPAATDLQIQQFQRQTNPNELNRSIQSVQDVPLSAPQDSQESGVVMPTLDCVAPLCEVADIDEDESEEDEQPTIQPKRISEAKTRLKAKKVPRRPTGTRKIGFKRDKMV
ncbi:hypothetical protein FXO37_18450, partial [Capsicum annuum]